MCYEVRRVGRDGRIDEIVRSDECGRVRVVDKDLERFEVNVRESRWIRDKIVRSRIGVVVVEWEVVEGSREMVGVDRIEDRRRNGRREEWVL